MKPGAPLSQNRLIPNSCLSPDWPPGDRAATLLPMADCPLAAVLTTAAVCLNEPDLTRLATDLTAPVRVGVGGSGDGLEATVRVLRAAGVTVCGTGEEPDLEVRVTGAGDLAVVADRELSLRAAAAAFDPVIDDETLLRLAEEFGVSRPGADRTAVRIALRRASGVEAVRADLDRVAAPVRYRRVQAVLAELAGRCAGPDGARLAAFLAGDDVVLSRMIVAADVLRESGIAVPAVPADPLAAAIRWHRYAAGPVSELHRACGVDLARGALRLWVRRPAAVRSVASRPAGRRAGLQQSRVEAAAGVRTACAALLTELQAGAAQTSRAEGFVAHARLRVAETTARIDADITARLSAHGAGCSDPPPSPEEPSLRTPDLEARLATLLGVTFGAGAALTLGRVLAGLLPQWSPAPAAGCAVIGLILGLWVARARRLLSERAAADRWVLEATAALRSALEDQVTARFAAADVMLLTSAPFRGSGRQ